MESDTSTWGDRLLQRIIGEPAPPVARHDKVIERLRSDLDALQIPYALSGLLRVALRRRYELRRLRRSALFAARVAALMLAVCVAFAVLLVVVGEPVENSETTQPKGPQLTKRGEKVVETAGFVVLVVVGPFIAIGLLAILGMLVAALIQVAIRIRMALRYSLVLQTADTISACAVARRAGGERAARELRTVAKQVGKVARSIERCHRTRGTVPRRSHRRPALKAHERQVIAALRRAERRLDADPKEGLRELAELLTSVAERYAHGRIGMLLDDEVLHDVVPEPDRGLARLLATVLLGTAAVVGVTLLNLPPAAQDSAITGAVLLVVLIVSAPSARRGVDLIDAIRGSGSP
ncbi:hypothetical protein ACXZ65_24635 [Streptomyces aculeolatus]